MTKTKLDLDEVKAYVENNIGSFHSSRLKSLKNLKLFDILKRKNPYLFRAKNIMLAGDLVKSFLDAHLSSQKEAIFGDFLESLAIFINERVYGGRKSSAEGIDLEFDRGGIRYVVAIKSGPNWGNSSQIKKMVENFKRAKKILHPSNSKLNIIPVNGCCYGRDNNPNKGDYQKLCGERFWHFISGKKKLYLEIIKPLGYKAKVKNEEFLEEYSKIINKFTLEFSQIFCRQGKIDWDALLKFNSSISIPKR